MTCVSLHVVFGPISPDPDSEDAYSSLCTARASNVSLVADVLRNSESSSRLTTHRGHVERHKGAVSRKDTPQPSFTNHLRTAHV
jgi:hypothetical protein